jgi:hypothetical protein
MHVSLHDLLGKVAAALRALTGEFYPLFKSTVLGDLNFFMS